MWKAVETKIGKTGVVEAKEETRRKRIREEKKTRKNQKEARQMGIKKVAKE